MLPRVAVGLLGILLSIGLTGCPAFLSDDWRIVATDASVPDETGSQDASVDKETSVMGDADAGATDSTIADSVSSSSEADNALDDAVADGASTDSGEASLGDAGNGCSSGDATAVYHDIATPQFWSTFDTATVSDAAVGFWGAAFDGRYTYLVPALNSVVARYDTQATFSAAASWTTFDTATVSSRAKSFNGAVFDGRYVYLVPQDSGSSGVVTRFDTRGSFVDVMSWLPFDAATVDPRAKAFSGGVFDGRYVYFVPSKPGGVATRYDTHGLFADPRSWSVFDTTSVSLAAMGFAGAVFDGHYVYFVAGTVARYDTSATFADPNSWTTYDATQGSPKSFIGAAFDGQYVYLAPYSSNTLPGGVVTRYDTHLSFLAATSWFTFDTTMVHANAKGFVGAAFDGRYVYFVPQAIGHDVVARYDTLGMFALAASWSTFDTTTNIGAGGFVGAAFDGRFLYFAPFSNGSYDGLVARFDTKTPSSMPCLPAFSGSFL